MEFTCGDCRFALGKKTYVMGILNVTPDSFSDGGKHFSPDDAVRRACEMAIDGADLIDIGAQSTRPGHTSVSAAQETERLKTLLPEILREVALPVSLDTYYPEVAAFAADCGVKIINDVSGRVHPQMADVIKRYGLGWVLMHAQEVSSDDAPDTVHAWLAGAAKKAAALGVRDTQICLDPGIGFGKNVRENLALIGQTKRVKVPGYAYLVGASRKRVIGACCGNPPADQRDAGTIAAHTAAILGGADIIRVHDTKNGVQAAKVADAILRGDIEHGQN